MPLIIKAKELLFDTLFPPLCIGCSKNLDANSKERGVCKECLAKIRINNSFFCPECKARMPDAKKNCHRNFQYALAAATDYNESTIKNLIWYFKYKRWGRMKIVLGDILKNYLENLNFNFVDYVVLPIPLHPKREKERGFNQSQILAEITAEKLNADLITDSLIRNKNTEIQVELKNREARAKNVADCFIIKNPEKIKNKNIIVVDDVFTSGATINEAIKTLKSCGAKKIIALVIAKA